MDRAEAIDKLLGFAYQADAEFGLPGVGDEPTIVDEAREALMVLGVTEEELET